METQGVDIHALLRRLAPRWLGWLGCGVVGLWLWSSVTTVAAFNIPQTDTTVYDQFGNLVAAQGIGTDVDWLGRIALSLTMGFPGPPAARELALLCLAGTAAVVLLWVTHRRDGHIRAVAAAGLAVSLGVAVVGGLAFASRTALAEAVTRFGWGVGEMSGFDSQFAAWGVTGGIGAVFAWAFLVMGFLPLPIGQVPTSPSITPDDPAAVASVLAEIRTPRSCRLMLSVLRKTWQVGRHRGASRDRSKGERSGHSVPPVLLPAWKAMPTSTQPSVGRPAPDRRADWRDEVTAPGSF